MSDNKFRLNYNLQSLIYNGKFSDKSLSKHLSFTFNKNFGIILNEIVFILLVLVVVVRVYVETVVHLN